MTSELRRLSPYIRIAQDANVRLPWRQSERIGLDYMLLYVSLGCVQLCIDGDETIAKPGDIFLLKPGHRCALTLITPSAHLPLLHFDLYCRDDSEWLRAPYSEYAALGPKELCMLRPDVTRLGDAMELPCRIKVRSVAHFEDRLFHIINSHIDPDPFSKIRARGQFLQLWSYLLDEHRIAKQPDLERYFDVYRDIREYIEINYGHPITLSHLGNNFHISPHHLQKVFKKLYGISPFEFLTVLRIKKAKELLAYSSLSISDIAMQLGFGSLYAFSRAFVRSEGLLPSAFRGGKPLYDESAHDMKESSAS